MDTLNRPIGYWIKLLDRLIEEKFDRTLADEGLYRRHWQILNALADGPKDAQRLDDALRPFWEGGAVTLTDVLGDLLHRSWIAENDALYALTAQGEAVHGDLGERVKATRLRLMEGLSGEEYQATVGALRRMVANLK